MNIYEILNKLEIKYNEISHEALFTVEDAKSIIGKIDGIGCKNLFLTDNKNYYLIIIKDNKKANIKEIAKLLNTSKLTFASIQDLNDILSLKKGSVTPFGIINDNNNRVKLLIDKDLKDNLLLFHPNTNTKTISINYNDLIKFINYESHEFILF